MVKTLVDDNSTTEPYAKAIPLTSIDKITVTNPTSHKGDMYTLLKGFWKQPLCSNCSISYSVSNMSTLSYMAWSCFNDASFHIDMDSAVRKEAQIDIITAMTLFLILSYFFCLEFCLRSFIFEEF